MEELTKQQKILIANESERNRKYFLKNKGMILEAYAGPTVIYKMSGGEHVIISSENEEVLRNTLKNLKDVVARKSAYWVTKKDRHITPDPF